MKKVYRISLNLMTALHINAGAGSDGLRLLIKSYRADENGGVKAEPYIPATTIKGLLRYRMEMNLRALDSSYSCVGKDSAEKDCGCILCRMFGKAGFKPSRVVVDNLYTMKEVSIGARTNNAINRFTRKTADGALVSQETVSAAPNQVFEGNMTVYYTGDMARYETMLLKSLEMIDSVGSSKSRGLGRVKIKVVEIDEES